MKALTVRQPHAAAIVRGLKRYETRSWPTLHRGALVIHASGRLDTPACDDLDEIGDWAKLGVAGRRELPLQVVLGVVEVEDCIRTEEVPAKERVWGNFAPGRWAWVLAHPRPIAGKPPRAVGQMGLWNWDEGRRVFGRS